MIVELDEAAQRLEPTELHNRATAELPAMLREIETLVRSESPSSDLSAVASSASTVAAMGAALLGTDAERITIDGCTHLRWRLGTDVGPRVLVLGHHDTVWPLGTVRRLPFAVADGVIRGPGCLDMKTGLVMAFHAIAMMPPNANVTLLITGDEEVGSQTSRALIESEARRSTAALVLEMATNTGAVKVARKGATTYRVAIEGRAAHAGLAPDDGISATLELAHQIINISDLANSEAGTTVVPTRAAAHTTTNTIAANAEFFVDVRAWTPDEQARVDTSLRQLQPRLPGARVLVTGRKPRPPMTTDSSTSLLHLARQAAQRLGLGYLEGTAVGGASDANFTAAVGTPTLDGLGAVGGGPHADDERVVIDAVAGRTALLALLATATLSHPNVYTLRK